MKIRSAAAVLLLASACVTATAPAPADAGSGHAAAPTAAHTAARRTVTLGHVPVHLRAGTTQVITVHHTSGWHARVSLWVRRHGHWRRILDTTSGRTGYGGLVAAARRRQGTGTTPLGTFRLISSFGTHARRPSWNMGYRHIRKGDFWVEDNASRFYNRYRNQSQGGFRWRLPLSSPNSSERLSSFPVQYEYAVVTSFNQGQVRHRGAGIFLHVNGSGATAGCVSVPRWMMPRVLARLAPARHPLIAIAR